MKFDVATEIACPPENAFDKLADARNETHWNTEVSRSELVSDEPVRAGSVFTTVNRGKEYRATIETYDTPRRLVFDVTGPQMDITASFAFAPASGGTKVDAEYDMRPKGLFKLMFAAMAPVIRKDLAKQSQNFKSFCER